MGRTAFSEEKQLPDLLKLAKNDGYMPGLILGQSSGLKDFVIHLARTPIQLPSQSQSEVEGKEKPPADSEKEKLKTVKNVADIQESVLADHARQVTWMLPGGMWVLGIFIVGPGDIFSDAVAQSKVKSILTKIYKCLSNDTYRYGNSPASEKLVLHLNSETKKYSCKGFDLTLPNASQSFRPVDWKFQSNYTKWHQLDCHYDFEQLSPYLITENKSTLPLRKHLKEILDKASEMVNKAICTIDGEIKDKSDSLEVTDKKKKGKTGGNKSNSKEEKTLEVNLYFQNDQMLNLRNNLEVIDTTGELRCIGALACRVYLHQKATVEEAVKAIKEDIIRSLSSRLEMHWDSIVEDEVESPDERVVLHEPPRRVLIPLPYSKVALCDYLFPGEGATETLDVLQELLGLSLTEGSVQKDFEGQTDPNQFYELTRNPSTATEERTSASSFNSHMVVTGIVVAALVLLASIILQFTSWPKNILYS